MMWMRVLVSLSPVLIMALALLLLDGYKLVKWPAACASLVKGALAALLCLWVNITLMRWLPIDLALFSRYVAPLVEEAGKAVFLFALIKRKRVGFLVDAAIHGAALGAGFAVFENIYYLTHLHESSLLLWFIRGFGTAIMHASCTTLFGILCKRLYDRQNHFGLSVWGTSYLAAVLLHSIFNHFLLPPIYTTLVMVIVLPPLIIAVYEDSERSLRAWLTLSMDEEMAMLEMILTGRFTESKFGQYMLSLREHFSPAVVVDLLCYLRIYLELAMRAKGILLLRQHGISAQPDAALKEKFSEFLFLEKSIGKTGKLALTPFMRLDNKELWQLYMLGER